MGIRPETARRGLCVMLLGAALLLPGGVVPAQDRDETVADVRAQLSVLNSQVQQLRDELVQRGNAGGLPADPATALTRLDQLEAELRRLTGRVDVLVNDLDRIIAEAGNRVSDIDFRLTELEGGDTSLLGQTEPLGGGLSGPQARPQAGEPQLAVGERADFDAAVAVAEAGEHARAADLFAGFLATYPGGPLTSEAQFRRSAALSEAGRWQDAARGYLDAFSGAPSGPFAASALLGLGTSLGRIGQVEEACLTFSEVATRYPDSDEAGMLSGPRAEFGCQ